MNVRTFLKWLIVVGDGTILHQEKETVASKKTSISLAYRSLHILQISNPYLEFDYSWELTKVVRNEEKARYICQ